MKNLKFNSLFILAFAALFSFTACQEDETVSPSSSSSSDNITELQMSTIDLVMDNPNFSTLYEAIERAELLDEIENSLTQTVFAPTNDAFDRFLAEAGISSIDAVPSNTLELILRNHIIVGDVYSSDLKTGYYSNTSPIYGNYLSKYINTDKAPGKHPIQINGYANVIDADIRTTNGVIHVVNEVIRIPDVVSFATSNDNFSILVQALTRPDHSIDFVKALSGTGPFTIFAPTNQAFINLLNSNPNWNNLNDIPVETLEAVLLYHVTSAGNVRSSDLINGQSVPTLLSDSAFMIDLTGQNPMIQAGSNTANIIATDVQASNGVIHVIDTVILP